MTTFLLWLIVIAGFLLSFLALIKPIIPGIPILWISFLVYHFGINRSELTTSFWVILIVFTLFLFVVDIVANNYFLKKYGGTKWGERVGCLSIIVGSFVIPPFGLIIVPFISVYAVEKLQNKSSSDALKVAFATVLSFLASSVAKGVLQFILIIIFIGYLLF